ncbi:MAG: YlbE-like family protein [Bacillus sp. (in: firmicutes)]
MRQDVYEWIAENEDYVKYLRMQPMWYRRLMRNPQDAEKFGTEAIYHFKKSVPDRVSQLTNGVQVASMMLNMLQTMGTQS